MTDLEKDAVVKLMEKTIENESSCTTVWAFHQITKLTSSSQPQTDTDRIVARMVENNEYLAVKRGYEFGYDFTISKNPNYELNNSIIT